MEPGDSQLSGAHWPGRLTCLQRPRRVRDPISCRKWKKHEERYPRLSSTYMWTHVDAHVYTHIYTYTHRYMHMCIHTTNYTCKIVSKVSLFHWLPDVYTLYIFWSYPQACFCQLQSNSVLPRKKWKKYDKYRFIVTASFIWNEDFCIFSDIFLVHFVLL